MRYALSAAAAGALYLGGSARGLPPVVASHFGLGGQADAFMSRGAYLGVMLVAIVVIPLGVALLGRWAAALPDAMVKLPNKAYWLAPERRAATLAPLAARLEWLSVALTAFLSYVHWLVLRANELPAPHLSAAAFAAGLALFVAFALLWAVALWRRFGRSA